MSKKSNPTVIGAFVVGAVVLLAAGVALFGGAELIAKTTSYVAYFTEDAKGLRVGSNVMLNGVRVGQVSGMVLIIDENSYESKTEVTIEVMPEVWLVARDGVVIGKGIDTKIEFEDVVNRGGLRALLQMESIVTGQLLVELKFRPDTEPVMRGGANTPYPEIPTIPSEIQELLSNIQDWIADLNKNLSAEELGARVQSVLKGVDGLVNSQDLRDTLAGINTIVNKEDTQELPAALQATLGKFKVAAGDASSLMQNADAKLDTLDNDLKPVIGKMVAALDEAQATLAAAKYQLQGESMETYQLDSTLKQVEGAARALKEFLDYLERNPEAVLRGKKK